MSAGAGLWIVGAGGLARGAVDAVRNSNRPVAGLVVSSTVGTEWFTGPVLDEAAFAARCGADAVVVAIGDNARRMQVAQSLAARRPGLVFETVVHPSSVVAASAVLGKGSILLGAVSVGPEARIGAQVLLYTGTIIEHDCVMADGASTGPGAILGGGVQVGSGSFIGLGARVRHGIVIGSNTVIGIGAVVTRDMPSNIVAVGVPARAIRTRKMGDPYL